MNAPPKTHKIASLADIMALTPDEFDRFLPDFLAWYTSCQPIKDLVSRPIDSFTWFDDGRGGIVDYIDITDPETCVTTRHSLTGEDVTDAQICEIARSTKTAEPGIDGYILPVAFARAVIAADRELQDARWLEELRAYELTVSNLRAEVARLTAACDKMSEAEVLAGNPIPSNPGELKILIERALDALTCVASEDGYGHACGRCDESIDSSGELREDIRAELAKPERPVNCGTGHCSCVECVATCKWEHDDTDDSWWTACGSSWAFDAGGPAENGVKFCYSCGKPFEIAGKA